MKIQLFSECLNQSCNYSCSILDFFFLTIHFYALILWKKIPSQSPLKCKSHVLHTFTRGSNVLWCGMSDWRRRHLYYMWFWWHCNASPKCLWVWKRLTEERQWNVTHSWAPLQHKTNYVCFSVRQVCVYSKAKAEADTRKGILSSCWLWRHLDDFTLYIYFSASYRYDVINTWQHCQSVLTHAWSSQRKKKIGTHYMSWRCNLLCEDWTRRQLVE